MLNHGTRVPVYASKVPPTDPQEWGLVITKVEGSKVRLTVYSSADSLVGEYKMNVNTLTKSGVEFEFEHPEDAPEIFMIFNPWCKGERRLLTIYPIDEVKSVNVRFALNVSNKPCDHGNRYFYILGV